MERVLIYALYSVREEGEEGDKGVEAFPMPCIYLQVEAESEADDAGGADLSDDHGEGESCDDDRDSLTEYVEVKIVLREDRDAFARTQAVAASNGQPDASTASARASPQLEEVFNHITDCLMANEGENYSGGGGGSGALFGEGDEQDGYDHNNGTIGGPEENMLRRFDEMLDVNGFNGDDGGDARFEDADEDA